MIWRPKDSLIVALDVASLEAAEAVAARLSPHVGLFKLGLQLFCAVGPQGVERLAAHGVPIFLDLKLHDIPNTVAGALKSCQLPGVAMLTVHALGGPAMIKAAAASCGLGQKLLAVTMLTSMDADTAEQVGVSRSLPEQVVALARMAIDSGADGVVASPQEIVPLREALGPRALIVTPGIRSATDERDDQSRTADAATAVRAGANYLVVGRPILKAPDPVQAAQGIVRQIQGAFGPH
ncbi:MAG TPA: orotidine-5'-phosphate decarboxylase [Candidatus Xenobia bacterium]|jgi:orotidine-5'-phosphate decarboxylase